MAKNQKAPARHKSVKKDWIENLVVNHTIKVVMDDELIDTIADRILDLLSQENTKIPQLQAKLKEVDGYISNILDAIQQGLFNTSAKKRLDELEQTKAEIETAIFSEQLQKPEITKDHIICYIERYRKINVNDLESKKRLIDTFVNSIYLYDDKIVFAFNYKDGTKSISLTELEEELSSDFESATPPNGI